VQTVPASRGSGQIDNVSWVMEYVYVFCVRASGRTGDVA